MCSHAIPFLLGERKAMSLDGNNVEPTASHDRIRVIHNAVFYPLTADDRRPFSTGVRCEDGSTTTLVRGLSMGAKSEEGS